MTPFTQVTGVAAPLAVANVDTDQIVPGRFLKGTTRSGLGNALLAPLRYDRDGRENSEFILNREPWTQAKILVALDNFGCGSSREHAAWALADFGIRVVLAPSFADIFYNNAFKNGLLAAKLQPGAIAALLALVSDPTSCILKVDLQAQKITTATDEIFPFELPREKREALLSGLDEIGRSLRLEPAIASFEAGHLLGVPSIPAWEVLSARLR